MKETLFKQTWWVSLAVVLAVLQTVFAVGAGTDSEETGVGRVFFFSVWAGGSVLAILGARVRSENRRVGDSMIAVGVLPAVATGVIAYWFPPIWLVTAAGLTVMWASFRDASAPVGAPAVRDAA